MNIALNNSINRRITAVVLVLWSSVVVFSAGCGEWLLGKDPLNTPEQNFDILWESFDRHYAHFDFKGIDWPALYAQYRPLVHNSMSDDELFDVMFEMLSHLRDGHVYLSTPERRIYTDVDHREAARNYIREVVVDSYLNGRYQTTGDDYITFGHIGAANDIGYIRISSLAGGNGIGDKIQGWIRDIDIALKAMHKTRGLIIDLRNNSGGRAFNAQYVAGRFADQRRPFVITQSRNGPDYNDFSVPMTWFVEPNGTVPYSKPIVVVTNRYTFSAAEWLTIALRQFPHVTHVGTPTGGGLAMFLPRELPNGWTYTISVQRTLDADGNNYEVIGVPPHIPVEFRADDRETRRDHLLDTAIEIIRSKRP